MIVCKCPNCWSEEVLSVKWTETDKEVQYLLRCNSSVGSNHKRQCWYYFRKVIVKKHDDDDDRSYFSPARKLEREREDGWTDEAAETSLKIIFEIAKEREERRRNRNADDQ